MKVKIRVVLKVEGKGALHLSRLHHKDRTLILLSHSSGVLQRLRKEQAPSLPLDRVARGVSIVVRIRANNSIVKIWEAAHLSVVVSIWSSNQAFGNKERV